MMRMPTTEEMLP
jgi:hypothetical protein